MMIEAIGGLNQVFNAQDLPSASPQTVDLPGNGPMERPSDVQAADFAHAASSTHVSEMNAVPAPSGTGVADGIARQVDHLADRMKTLSRDHEAPEVDATENSGKPDLIGTATIDESLRRLNQAFMFAIEAGMAGHGSSETTRTLNALLKGQ
jgi:hypothetical protein